MMKRLGKSGPEAAVRLAVGLSVLFFFCYDGATAARVGRLDPDHGIPKVIPLAATPNGERLRSERSQTVKTDPATGNETIFDVDEENEASFLKFCFFLRSLLEDI
jgi:hypothetical protein